MYGRQTLKPDLLLPAVRIFSFEAHLYGEITNCIVYFIIGVIGWVLWNRKSAQPIRHCSWKERRIYLSVLTVLSVGLYLILKQTSDPLPPARCPYHHGGYVATYYILMRKVDTGGSVRD